MKVSILCTDPQHPIVEPLRKWGKDMASKGHVVSIVHEKTELEEGDILFLVSCSQYIGKNERQKYRATLVLHASDLPKGRGWSPHIWAILSGEKKITVCVLEAADQIDCGNIWLKKNFVLEGHELLPEINKKLFEVELSLMEQVVEKFENIEPTPQMEDGVSYMSKRTPEDSRLDPDKTLAEQFNLLRVVDADRYPGFFDYLGQRYLIKIEKDGSR